MPYLPVSGRNKRAPRHKRRTDKFYHSTSWRKLRKSKLQDSPLCEHCLAKIPEVVSAGKIIDHIIPIRVSYTKRLSYSNLQTLCQACHNIKTQEDKRIYSL